MPNPSRYNRKSLLPDCRRTMRRWTLACWVVIAASLPTYAVPMDVRVEHPIHETLSEQIRETYPFAGLAFYYNQVSFYTVDSNGAQRLQPDEPFTLAEGQWLAAVGRLNVAALRHTGLSGALDESGQLQVTSRDSYPLKAQRLPKSELHDHAPELDALRYAHLWGPLAWLSKLCESSIAALHALGLGWGAAVLGFAVLLRLVLLPVSLLTDKWQRHVKAVQEQLAPTLTHIKKTFDGEEAHNRLMQAHSDLGVSPFFTLKPMIGTLIQIPFLIAAFNALGEMSQLAGASFLWIADLAYPDAIARLPLHLPMFGHTVNLLPFIMTAVTLASGSALFGGQTPQTGGIGRWLMALVFFVLFFPFPAAMILFWTFTNLLQLIQSRITGRAHTNA